MPMTSLHVGPWRCKRTAVPSTFKGTLMRRCKLLVAAAAIMAFVSSAQAGHYCDHCGCQRNCRKVCRLECGKKKDTKIEYAAECEDFCVPCHSKKCGVNVECDGNGHRHRTVIWQPTCAKVYTRKKLVKNEVTKEVPDYKWVVEEYCCVCGQCIKVDGQAKAACAQVESDRLIAAAKDDGGETSLVDAAQPASNVGYVEVVSDDADELTEAADTETPVEGPKPAPVNHARRLLHALFSR